MVSGRCLEGAWEVSEPKMIFLLQHLGEEKKIGPKKLKIKLFTKAKLSLFYPFCTLYTFLHFLHFLHVLHVQTTIRHPPDNL